MINLQQLQNEMDEFRKRRKELNYTGLKDLEYMRKMSAIRREVTTELIRVRTQMEVCPLSMLSELRQREDALLEWKHNN